MSCTKSSRLASRHTSPQENQGLRLLEQALEESNRAGIATFVMRGREHPVALKAEKGLLAVHTLHWSDEIRDPHQEIPDLPKSGKASAGELKMAHQLIDALAIDWQPEDYRDVYQEKVAVLIEAKQAGETVEKAEPAPKATGAVGLMECRGQQAQLSCPGGSCPRRRLVNA
ncbi:Ku protein [Streptomyces sp. NPDC091273]|uniref:Ku protein n=1 Tax=Streptomyces sp. NPDC091273 TaxID=3365982 RepID=UPI0037FAB6FE